MLNKQELNNYFDREIEITCKVLKAVPEDQLHFKAHDKSNSISQLIKTFSADLVLAKTFVIGQEPGDFMSQIADFEHIDQGIENLRKHKQDFLDTLETISEEDIATEATAWGQTMPRSSFALWMLFDHIHHRGQLSVYVRLAGGLVPSIYGPSADEK